MSGESRENRERIRHCNPKITKKILAVTGKPGRRHEKMGESGDLSE